MASTFSLHLSQDTSSLLSVFSVLFPREAVGWHKLSIHHSIRGPLKVAVCSQVGSRGKRRRSEQYKRCFPSSPRYAKSLTMVVQPDPCLTETDVLDDGVISLRRLELCCPLTLSSTNFVSFCRNQNCNFKSAETQYKATARTEECKRSTDQKLQNHVYSKTVVEKRRTKREINLPRLTCAEEL